MVMFSHLMFLNFSKLPFYWDMVTASLVHIFGELSFHPVEMLNLCFKFESHKGAVVRLKICHREEFENKHNFEHS